MDTGWESGGVGGAMRQRRVMRGEGMRVAEFSGVVNDAFGRHVIKAGITRIAHDHEWLRDSKIAALFGLGRDPKPRYLLAAPTRREEPWRL